MQKYSGSPNDELLKKQLDDQTNNRFKKMMELFGVQSAHAQDVPAQTQDLVDAASSTNPEIVSPQDLQDAQDVIEQAQTPPLQSVSTQVPFQKSPQQIELEKRLQDEAEAQLKAQEQNVADQKEMFNAVASQPVQTDLSAAQNYLNYYLGNNVKYNAPESPQEKQAKLLQMLKMQEASQSELSKNRIANLKAQLDAKSQDAAIRYQLAQQKLGQNDNRMDLQAHHRVVQAIKNNKPLQQDIQNYKNLNKALNLTLNKPDLSPQDIHEFQQSIRSALGIKGTSGVTEREETYLKNAGWNVEAVKQFLSGEPAQISKNQPLVQHLVRIAEGMKDQLKSNVDDGFALASSGYEEMYARRPDLSKNISDMYTKVDKITTTSPQQKKVIAESAKTEIKKPAQSDLDKEFDAYMGKK